MKEMKRMMLAFFWHIYIPRQSHHSFKIINRHFELLKSSCKDALHGKFL